MNTKKPSGTFRVIKRGKNFYLRRLAETRMRQTILIIEDSIITTQVGTALLHFT